MMMMRRPLSLRVRAKPRHLPYIYVIVLTRWFPKVWCPSLLMKFPLVKNHLWGHHLSPRCARTCGDSQEWIGIAVLLFWIIHDSTTINNFFYLDSESCLFFFTCFRVFKGFFRVLWPRPWWNPSWNSRSRRHSRCSCSAPRRWRFPKSWGYPQIIQGRFR